MKQPASFWTFTWAALLGWLITAALSAQPAAAQAGKDSDPPPKPAESQAKSAESKAESDESRPRSNATAVPRLASLDEMLKVALEHNPDVRAAAAGIQAAEAELDRTRLEVVQKVIAYRDRRLQQESRIVTAFTELANAKQELANLEAAKQVNPKRIVRNAQALVAHFQARLEFEQKKLAEIEAELPFLLGRRPGELRFSIAADGGPKANATGSESDAARRKGDELLELARTAFQLQLEAARAGLSVKMEQVCEWSRRWMDAELATAESKRERIAAIESHLDRSRQLLKFAETAYKAAVIGQGEFVAVQYFVAAAELRLAMAKGE